NCVSRQVNGIVLPSIVMIKYASLHAGFHRLGADGSGKWAKTFSTRTLSSPNLSLDTYIPCISLSQLHAQDVPLGMFVEALQSKLCATPVVGGVSYGQEVVEFPALPFLHLCLHQR